MHFSFNMLSQFLRTAFVLKGTLWVNAKLVQRRIEPLKWTQFIYFPLGVLYVELTLMQTNNNNYFMNDKLDTRGFDLYLNLSFVLCGGSGPVSYIKRMVQE